MAENGFVARLSERRLELKERWCAVYGSTAGLEAFCRALAEAYDRRPAALRVLDRKRPASDGWFTEAAYRGVLLDLADLGGSPAEAAGYLPYFAEAGFSVAELRTAPEADEALSALTSACREEGIDVCVPFRLDAVPADDPWAEAAMAGGEDAERFFLFDGWEVPDIYEQTLPHSGPAERTHFFWNDRAGRVVMCQSGEGFWDLDYHRPAVITGMLARLFALADCGVGMVRLCGLDTLWKTPGTNGAGLAENHRVAALLRLACELVCPSLVLAGSSRDAAFLGTAEAPECHLLSDDALPDLFWNAVATQDARMLSAHLRETADIPSLRCLRRQAPLAWDLDYAFLAGLGMGQESHRYFLNTYYTGNFPGSTATGRWTPQGIWGSAAQLAGLERAAAEADEEAQARADGLLQMMHAAALSLPGIPFLAAGDDFGGAETWDETQGRSHGAFSALLAGQRNDLATVQAGLFWRIQELAGIRAENPCFSPESGAVNCEVYNDHILAVCRQAGEARFLALYNFSLDEQMVWLDEEEPYTDALTGEETAVRGLKLAPRQWRWLTQGQTREEDDGVVWTLDDL